MQIIIIVYTMSYVEQFNSKRIVILVSGIIKINFSVNKPKHSVAMTYLVCHTISWRFWFRENSNPKLRSGLAGYRNFQKFKILCRCER